MDNGQNRKPNIKQMILVVIVAIVHLLPGIGFAILEHGPSDSGLSYYPALSVLISSPSIAIGITAIVGGICNFWIGKNPLLLPLCILASNCFSNLTILGSFGAPFLFASPALFGLALLHLLFVFIVVYIVRWGFQRLETTPQPESLLDESSNDT